MFCQTRNSTIGLVRYALRRRVLISAFDKRLASTNTTSQEKVAPIPIIDMGRLGLNYNPEPEDVEWQRVAGEITDAFKTVGFAYIAGHGFPDNHVQQLTQAGKTFFDLSEKQKMEYVRDLEKLHGYLPLNSERVDLTYSYELRESYDLRIAEELFFPDEAIPDFRPASINFVDSCKRLTYRILGALAHGLDLHPAFFMDAHKHIGSYENSTIGRVIHYPPIPEGTGEGTIRISPHSDITTVTLVFQDDIGGLQILDPDGNWSNAPPIPGTIVVNIGDLLHFWTMGKLKATKHRVVIPKEETKRAISRRSLAYFVVTDDSVILKPIDGSAAFEPITTRDYLYKRLAEIYNA